MTLITTLEYFKKYPQLVTILLNIKHGMEIEKYDFPFVIVGDTGNGKSMLLLHIIEIWYKVCMKQKLTPEHIRYLTTTREGWITNFKNIEKFDINANDEGTNSLMSSETRQKFNIMLNKLYNVVRKKHFLTPLLMPKYFAFPLWFRERIRGAIEVDRRGHWYYYTKRDLFYANAYNENRQVKSLRRARASYKGYFPDYQGILREPYDNMENESTEEILDELIMDCKMNKTSTVDLNFDKVSKMILEGGKQIDICKKLKISSHTHSKILKAMRLKNMI